MTLSFGRNFKRKGVRQMAKVQFDRKSMILMAHNVWLSHSLCVLCDLCGYYFFTTEITEPAEKRRVCFSS